jgi:hypothetical protein
MAARLDLVDYSDYAERNMHSVSAGNWDECFQGILRYITLRSQNKYNATEIRIGYRSLAVGADPGNILDYRTPAAYESGKSVNEFMTIEFVRVELRPCAYAIRSGPRIKGGPQLNCFVFQGVDSSGNWITLDERNCPYDSAMHYGIRLFFLDSSDYFSRFRLMATRGGAFALTAFEIHGAIRLKDELSVALDTSISLEDSDEEGFDPWSFPD